MSVVNQNNYYDEQNNVIDIEKIYNDYIREIDAARSVSNISNTVNNAFFKTLSKDSVLSVAKLVKIEDSAQESRCHAFFRLIGFPVVANDFRYYNPGFDIIYSNNRSLPLEEKINIANNPIDGFRNLSFKRETYYNNFLRIFSQVGGITPSVLSLTIIESRNFNVPFLNADPFEMSVLYPTYVAGLFGNVGKKRIPLTQYKDQNGLTVSETDLNATRFHYIKPFITDPRIDFTVYPVKNRVAVPFVENKSQLKIGEGAYVKRPLLEKIIRDRLTVEDDIETIGSSGKTIRDYILSVDSVKDEPIIRQMTGDLYETGAFFQFNKYFNIIRAMCIELVNAQLTVKRIQSKYYWLPSPSTTGPEGGVSVRNLIISKEIGKDLITTADLDLINATLKKFSNNFNKQVASEDTAPDRGKFAFGRFETTFDGTDSEALGDTISETVDSLSKKRSKEMKDAGAALRKIEIIMGEFSGLGLCDIISIVGALHIMPENNLIGFLDDDAFNRMIKSLNKEQDGLTNPGIQVAIESFSKKVHDLYNLMDKIYFDVASKNKLV